MAESAPDHGDTDGGAAANDESPSADWYRWGRVVLYAEMLLAVLVTGFALYLAVTGSAGVLA